MTDREEKPAKTGAPASPDEMIDRGKRGYLDRSMKPADSPDDRAVLPRQRYTTKSV